MYDDRHFVSISVVDDRPEKRYLTTHVRGQLCAAGEKAWKDLGEQLKLSDESLGTIEANARGDVIKGCDSLFKLWLEKQPKASWRQLIEALEVIEQDNLATQIKEKLEPSVASASSSTSTATAPQTQKGTAYITRCVYTKNVTLIPYYDLPPRSKS